jgi:hypothetical protein
MSHVSSLCLLSVIKQNVVMLSVVAPKSQLTTVKSHFFSWTCKPGLTILFQHGLQPDDVLRAIGRMADAGTNGGCQ